MHPVLHGRIRHKRFGGLARARRHQQTPQTGNLHEHEPEVRIGDIGDRRQIVEMILERKFRAGAQPELRECQSRKVDAQADANDARCAVRCNQVFPVQCVWAVRRFDLQGYPPLVLLGAGCTGMEQYLHIVHLAEFVDDDVGQFVLFALDAVRVARVILEDAEIPMRDDTFFRVPVLPCRADDPLFDQLVDDAEIVEHVERRRMKCRGAQINR